MADDVEKMDLTFGRVLDSFKLQNLKDSQQEALQYVFKGQDVFIIQPLGSNRHGQRLKRPTVCSGRIKASRI